MTDRDPYLDLRGARCGSLTEHFSWSFSMSLYNVSSILTLHWESDPVFVSHVPDERADLSPVYV